LQNLLLKFETIHRQKEIFLRRQLQNLVVAAPQDQLREDFESVEECKVPTNVDNTSCFTASSQISFDWFLLFFF